MSRLLSLFEVAVDAVNGEAAVRRAMNQIQGSDVYLVAVGKAAPSMARGAVSVLSDRLISGLVITKYQHLTEDLLSNNKLYCMESAHPVPDQLSLDAGEALFNFVEHIPEHAQLVFLTSGGASSLVELLPSTVTLADLQKVNVFLHQSGLDINQMNLIRRAMSRIKGGRLASALNCQKINQFLISDVPGDELISIGSGLLIKPSQDEALMLEQIDLPEWLHSLLVSTPAPAATNPVWNRITSTIVASNAIACEAIADKALSNGMQVQLESGVLTGDVGEMSRQIAKVLQSPEAKPGLYIWGGETTVTLPSDPGRGGRNQQLAVQLALDMHGNDSNQRLWSALCCGTDGSDGPTNDAGGVVDFDTIKNGAALGLDVQTYLDNADCGNYLELVGALVTTGPTGTNVMDVVVAVLLED